MKELIDKIDGIKTSLVVPNAFKPAKILQINKLLDVVEDRIKAKKPFNLLASKILKRTKCFKGTILEFIPEYEEWRATPCPTSAQSYEVFHNTLWFIKIFGLVCFIGLMIWNITKYHNYYMFTKNPKTLVIESSAFGLSVSLPVMFSWWLRKDVVGNDKVFNLSIICFIIFFILYLILEASGLWAFVFGDNIKESLENTDGDAIIEPTVQPTIQPTVQPTIQPTVQPTILPTELTLSCKDKTAELEKELNKLKIIEPKSINILSDIVKGKTSGLSKIIIAICTIIIIFGFIIMVVAGNGVNKSIINDDDTHIYKHLLFCSPYATFILETLVFAVLSSAPIFLIAHGRNNLSEESVYFDSGTIKEFLLGAGKFSILFYILHYSGFWHHVLAPSNSK